MNPTHGPRAWSLDDRSRLRAGGREQWTVLSGTSAIRHGLHFADRANEARPKERSDRGRFSPSGEKNVLHSGSYEHRVPKIKTKQFSVCVC